MGDKAIKGLSPILRKLIKEDNDIDTMEEAIAHLTGLTNDDPKRQKKLAFGVKAANRDKKKVKK
mgnify:FL=1